MGILGTGRHSVNLTKKKNNEGQGETPKKTPAVKNYQKKKKKPGVIWGGK